MTQTSETSRSAQLEINAPVERIFDLLATPGEHHRFDASSMVGAPVTAGRLSRVGEVFTMEMSHDAGSFVERYRTDNHVTVLDAPRCVEWAVAPAGRELLGWRWRYELSAVSSSRTLVTLVFDWAGTSEVNIQRFGVPLLSSAQLLSSLSLLAGAVE